MSYKTLPTLILFGIVSSWTSLSEQDNEAHLRVWSLTKESEWSPALTPLHFDSESYRELGKRCARSWKDLTETVLGSVDLPLPERAVVAMGGTELKDRLANQGLKEREAMIRKEVLQGNLPGHLKTLNPLTYQREIDCKKYIVTLFVGDDYLALGSDTDSFLMPMTPILAQDLADKLDCLLPTPFMVDRIWEGASIHLKPQPISPSPAMTTVPVFADHQNLIRTQLQEMSLVEPLGKLVAGHKKDVVIISETPDRKDRVTIYGWHQLDGAPIQPVYSGHVNWYADYSHGVRLVSDTCLINNQESSVKEMLRDPALFQLFSNEPKPFVKIGYEANADSYPGQE